MDHKRDSQRQRAKNLQYKSKGRPRQNQTVASVESTAVEAEDEASGSDAADFRRTRNLGSNWDRYAEPEEAEVNVTQEGGAVLKRSEGLDYSALLEEADALLSSGGAYLLKHYEVELDEEDPFSLSGTDEEPMPLHIDLTSLNNALLSLSMAERLGLEEELFFTERQESASTRDVGAASSTSTPSNEAVQPVAEREPQGSSPSERDVSRSSPSEAPASTVHFDRGRHLHSETASQPLDNRSESSIESRLTQLERSPDSSNLGAGKHKDPSTGSILSTSSPAELWTTAIDEERKARIPGEPSSTGPEENEDEDLLNLLLGGNERTTLDQKEEPIPAVSNSMRGVANRVGSGQIRTSGGEEQRRKDGLPFESRRTSEGKTGASERNVPSRQGSRGSTVQWEQGKRTGQGSPKGIVADQDFDSWLDSIG